LNTVFLPYRRFTISSRLSLDEARRRIASNIEPMKRIRWSGRSEKPYEGEATMEGFRMRRIINYRNSFLPLIRGQWSTRLGKSQLDVTMRLHHFVPAFMVIWCAFLLPVINAMRSSENPQWLMPAAMLLIPYPMAAIAFGVEAAKSQRFLLELLEGTI
jgi:hypothetical protein